MALKLLVPLINMTSNFHLPESSRPNWLQYPDLFNQLVERQEDDLDLWYLMEFSRVEERRKGMAERYPARELVPFATRDDNDDVACWEKNNPSGVVIIHDFASSGHEEKQVFTSFQEWYDNALKEAEEF